jgi:hypothetical protein
VWARPELVFVERRPLKKWERHNVIRAANSRLSRSHPMTTALDRRRFRVIRHDFTATVFLASIATAPP